MLKSGDPVFGSIRNKSFEVVTLWGNLHLQAKEVVGMAGGKGGQVRFALLDGQVVSGKANDGVLNVMLGQSGRLRIPFEKISQWSYRITKERPRDNKYTGAYVALRTGDRLAFDAEKLDIRFRTRHGVIDLSPGHLLEITLDNRGNGVHRVAFRNGSRLAGFLEPESLRFVLKSGRKVAISRNLLVRMRFVAEGEGDGTLTRVLLSNGDKLFGQLAADKFKLTTDYGQIDISRNRVKSIQFHPQDLGRTVVHTWKGSVLKGRMRRSPLGFQIAPGTKLRIHAGHLVSLVRPLALPLETARRQIEILVAQLGAESYKDRQAATKALVAMGKSILPILRKQLSSKDPEVNHRISLILEQLSTASSSPPTVVPHPARHIMLKGRGG